MASFIFNIAKSRMMSGDLDLNSDSIRVLLLMTNTNIDDAGKEDADNISAIQTGWDEFNGSGYDTYPTAVALASPSVSVDDTDNEGVFTASNLTFSALGAGARSIEGALLYEHVDGTAANDIPIAWIAFPAPVAANGGDITIAWNAEGIINLN